MKKAIEHFKSTDKVMHGLALKFGSGIETGSFEIGDHFERLARAIVGQQLSVKAAATIWGRFAELAGDDVKPERVLKIEDQKMRDAGMSWAKIKYVNDLASKVISGEIHLEKIEKMEDEEVVEELTLVKGIGRWTAEMYLMFTLNRPDVFSVGDLGLRRAMERAYGLEKPSDGELVEMAKAWSPYRTYACQVLWNSLDNAPK